MDIERRIVEDVDVRVINSLLADCKKLAGWMNLCSVHGRFKWTSTLFEQSDAAKLC